jgi:hypothetical protein
MHVEGNAFSERNGLEEKNESALNITERKLKLPF